jgi:hypothetical protein
MADAQRRPLDLFSITYVRAEQAAEKTLNEAHGFSRVPMSLRLTPGDENLGE